MQGFWIFSKIKKQYGRRLRSANSNLKFAIKCHRGMNLTLAAGERGKQSNLADVLSIKKKKKERKKDKILATDGGSSYLR